MTAKEMQLRCAKVICGGCRTGGKPVKRDNRHFPDVSGGSISIDWAHPAENGRYVSCYAHLIWGLE